MLYRINSFVNGLVWGPCMILLLLGSGLFLTLRLRGLPFRFKDWFRETLGSLFKAPKEKNGISPFAAMSAALAGTLGIGNIAGVATAVVAGGPGAVFWMWVSALFGMVTKYAEVVLACLYRKTTSDGRRYGGPMFYMRDGMRSRFMAILFSVLCAFAAFGTGNIAQVSAVSASMQDAFGVPPLVSGILTALLVLCLLGGGMKRISGITEKVVPFMGMTYILGAIAVLVIHAEELPQVLSMILQDAFKRNAVCGGTAGYVMANAMKYGLSRGIFSNEAGLGSAPMAHASADFKSPVQQGMWGIFEVFFDTVVMCTMTAFVVLSCGLQDSGLNGISLTIAAFSSVFGGLSESILSIFTVFFAVTSMVCWGYYGETAVRYLFHRNGVIRIYRVLFATVAVCGALGSVELVYEISDTLNGLMTLPNMIAVLWLSPQVVRATRAYKESKKAIHR